jgi:hypothetical protein
MSHLSHAYASPDADPTNRYPKAAELAYALLRVAANDSDFENLTHADEEGASITLPDTKRYKPTGLIGSRTMKGITNNVSVEYGPSERIQIPRREYPLSVLGIAVHVKAREDHELQSE